MAKTIYSIIESSYSQLDGETKIFQICLSSFKKEKDAVLFLEKYYKENFSEIDPDYSVDMGDHKISIYDENDNSGLLIEIIENQLY